MISESYISELLKILKRTVSNRRDRTGNPPSAGQSWWFSSTREDRKETKYESQYCKPASKQTSKHLCMQVLNRETTREPPKIFQRGLKAQGNNTKPISRTMPSNMNNRQRKETTNPAELFDAK